eukprot:SAG22_NODE_9917_length_563_cov_1.775862_1_plen_52_part_00
MFRARPPHGTCAPGLGEALSSIQNVQNGGLLTHVIDDLGWNDLGFRNPDIE